MSEVIYSKSYEELLTLCEQLRQI